MSDLAIILSSVALLLIPLSSFFLSFSWNLLRDCPTKVKNCTQSANSVGVGTEKEVMHLSHQRRPTSAEKNKYRKDEVAMT